MVENRNVAWWEVGIHKECMDVAFGEGRDERARRETLRVLCNHFSSLTRLMMKYHSRDNCT